VPPHVIKFDEEFTLEFRGQDVDSAMRFIRFRILTHHEEEHLTSVRFEIQDDADLYYFVESAFNEREFRRLKQANELLVDFPDFPDAVEKLLKDSLKTQSEITVIFYEEGNGTGTLEFNQLLDLRAVEIFKIRFTEAPPEFIAKQVQHRYEKLNFEFRQRKLMLAKFKQEMQSRNPILYRAIDPRLKTSPRKA
jgi:hypothetical protein